jgi:hypothetical protein
MPTAVEAIPELSIVALKHAVESKRGTVPEGRKGTIVHVEDSQHYLVEFPEPRCVLALERDDIRLV